MWWCLYLVVSKFYISDIKLASIIQRQVPEQIRLDLFAYSGLRDFLTSEFSSIGLINILVCLVEYKHMILQEILEIFSTFFSALINLELQMTWVGCIRHIAELHRSLIQSLILLGSISIHAEECSISYCCIEVLVTRDQRNLYFILSFKAICPDIHQLHRGYICPKFDFISNANLLTHTSLLCTKSSMLNKANGKLKSTRQKRYRGASRWLIDRDRWDTKRSLEGKMHDAIRNVSYNKEEN